MIIFSRAILRSAFDQPGLAQLSRAGQRAVRSLQPGLAVSSLVYLGWELGWGRSPPARAGPRPTWVGPPQPGFHARWGNSWKRAGVRELVAGSRPGLGVAHNAGLGACGEEIAFYCQHGYSPAPLTGNSTDFLARNWSFGELHKLLVMQAQF